MNLTELMHGLKIFNGISDNDIEDIAIRLNGVKKRYAKGEIVVHAGMEANRLMAVAMGHLHVYTESLEEHAVLVREIGADEVLGLWILHMPEIACWPGTVVAAEDSVLVSFDMKLARRFFASSAPQIARLSANASSLLARELFSTWRKLMVMDEPTIESRIKAYLTELDNETGNTGEVVVPFNRERMAEYFGVTRPSLSRAIGHLRDQGVLSWRKNVFRLRTRL